LAALGDRLGFAASVLRKRSAYVVDFLEAPLRTPADVTFVPFARLDEFSLRGHVGRPFRCWLYNGTPRLEFQGYALRICGSTRS
jgi:hypothetical protein